MDTERTPELPPHLEMNELEMHEESLESASPPTLGKGGRETFGDPDIPPNLYHCPTHGALLAQDVLWKRDSRPYCPKCGALMDARG